MERSKKQKHERQLRVGCKTITSLQPTLTSSHSQEEAKASLLSKVYPQIGQLNSLRIFTILQITYLLEVYLELLDKQNPSLLCEFKIGIIGGGINGRLILNSILPLSKDGLNLSNITVSTRQTQNFKMYVQTFGVKCHFENELTAREADFLIVATPATLDNWVIADLKEPIMQRIEATEKKYPINLSTLSLIAKLTSEKSKLSTTKIEEKKKTQDLTEKQARKFPFRPLVYILTSDFHEEKCIKFFNFPVLTPSIRVKDIPSIKETLQLFAAEQMDNLESHQKILAWWLLKQHLKSDGDGSQHLENADSKKAKEATIKALGQKYDKTPFSKILEVLNFVSENSQTTASITSSASNSVSVTENIRENQKEETLTQILEVVTSHGEVDETLFKKLRKWSMAFNNFIS